MNSIYEYDENFEPNSPEAILRCAVAVASIDGEFSIDEQARVWTVYSDICQEMTYAYNSPEVSETCREIAESTSETMHTIRDFAAKLEYVEELGREVTDRDLREMTLIMALRVAGGDAELAASEFQALKTLANLWSIRLSDVLAPYSSRCDVWQSEI